MMDQKSHIVNWECSKIVQDFHQAKGNIERSKDPLESYNMGFLKQNDLEKLGKDFLE